MAVTINDGRPKVALITGITGQDGTYLSKYLLDEGYVIHGTYRPTATFDRDYHLDFRDFDSYDTDDRLFFHPCDMVDGAGLQNVILKTCPAEIYNLAAQSHVHTSFKLPEYTANVNALGLLRILETVRQCEIPARIYQASTSEMYGGVLRDDDEPVIYSEWSMFNPKSPYASSKLMAHHLVKNYRESYGMYAVAGILFNHESPYRGREFVTQKIIKGLDDWKFDRRTPFELGNLDSIRDWGHAQDYVDAMFRMMHNDTPKDYVIATGVGTTVREFVIMAANEMDIEGYWTGEGEDEKFISHETDEPIITINPYFYRPNEVDALVGDSSRARAELEWKPLHTLQNLIYDMVKAT